MRRSIKIQKVPKLSEYVKSPGGKVRTEIRRTIRQEDVVPQEAMNTDRV